MNHMNVQEEKVLCVMKKLNYFWTLGLVWMGTVLAAGGTWARADSMLETLPSAPTAKWWVNPGHAWARIFSIHSVITVKVFQQFRSLASSTVAVLMDRPRWVRPWALGVQTFWQRGSCWGDWAKAVTMLRALAPVTTKHGESRAYGLCLLPAQQRALGSWE